MKKKKPIILDDESSSEEEKRKESPLIQLPRGFFDEQPDNDTKEEVDGDIHKDLIRKIAERVSKIPNFSKTRVISNTSSNQFAEKIPHKFNFPTPLMRILVKNLYKHQKQGVDFLHRNLVRKKKGVILADFMGLGKSLQVVSIINIMAMSASEKRPVLLICPKVVINHWVGEFQKFNNWVEFDRIGVKNFKRIEIFKIPSKFSNTKRILTVKEWFTNHGVLIMSYGLFVRLWKCGFKDVNDRFFSPYLMLVLDEGHRIRTDKTVSQTSMALSKVQTTQKVILTGYPLQNNLVEYWYLISFVRPSFLGDLKDFKSKIVKPITKGFDQNSLPSEIEKSKIYGKILHQQLSPYIMRRGIRLLRKTLPIQKREIVIYCKLTESQHYIYNKVLDFLSQRKRKMSVVFWAFSFLTLVCNHPQIARNYCDSKERVYNQLFALNSKKMVDEDDPEEEEEDVIVKKEVKVEMKDEDEEEEEEESEKPQRKKKRMKDEEEEEEGEGEGEVEDFDFYDVRRFLSREGVKELQEILSSSPTTNNNNNINDDPHQPKFESGKISVLLHLLFASKRAGDKVVVFTKSIMTLDFLERLLSSKSVGVVPRISRIDGGMDLSVRQKRINEFNEPGSGIDVMIISTLSCCEGVNLYAANRVILVDVNWNPSNDVEATSRVYRFGQKKHVSIYRLLTYGSIENMVHVRQLQKMKLLGLICDDKNMNLMEELISEKDLSQKLPATYDLYIKSLPKYLVENIILNGGGRNFERDNVVASLHRLLREDLVQVRTQNSLLGEEMQKSKRRKKKQQQKKDNVIIVGGNNYGDNDIKKKEIVQKKIKDIDGHLFDLKQDGFFQDLDGEEALKPVKIPTHLISPDQEEEEEENEMKDEDEEEEEEEVIIISKRKKNKKDLKIEIPDIPKKEMMMMRMEDDDEVDDEDKKMKKKKKKNIIDDDEEDEKEEFEEEEEVLPPHLVISPKDFGSNWFENVTKSNNPTSSTNRTTTTTTTTTTTNIPKDNNNRYRNNNNNNNNSFHFINPIRGRGRGRRGTSGPRYSHHPLNNNMGRRRNNFNNQQVPRYRHPQQLNKRQQQQNNNNTQQSKKSKEDLILERQVSRVVDNSIVSSAYFVQQNNTFRRYDVEKVSGVPIYTPPPPPPPPTKQQQNQQHGRRIRHPTRNRNRHHHLPPQPQPQSRPNQQNNNNNNTRFNRQNMEEKMGHREKLQKLKILQEKLLSQKSSSSINSKKKKKKRRRRNKRKKKNNEQQQQQNNNNDDDDDNEKKKRRRRRRNRKNNNNMLTINPPSPSSSNHLGRSGSEESLLPWPDEEDDNKKMNKGGDGDNEVMSGNNNNNKPEQGRKKRRRRGGGRKRPKNWKKTRNQLSNDTSTTTTSSSTSQQQQQQQQNSGDSIIIRPPPPRRQVRNDFEREDQFFYGQEITGNNNISNNNNDNDDKKMRKRSRNLEEEFKTNQNKRRKT